MFDQKKVERIFEKLGYDVGVSNPTFPQHDREIGETTHYFTEEYIEKALLHVKNKRYIKTAKELFDQKGFMMKSFEVPTGQRRLPGYVVLFEVTRSNDGYKGSFLCANHDIGEQTRIVDFDVL